MHTNAHIDMVLGIDVGRHKGHDGYGSNERIFVDRYVGGWYEAKKR